MKLGGKRWLKRTIFGKIGFLILVILFVFLAKSTWSVYQKSNFAKQNLDSAEQELTELSEREQALGDELNRLSTRRGIEEEIRHQFDVGHEGEHLIVLVDTPEPEKTVEYEEPNIWTKIVTFFGFR